MILYVCADDVSSKLKKNNFNIPKHIVYGNEDCIKVDNNIILVHEGNIRGTVFENCDLLSNQLILQPSDSYNFNSTKIEPGMLYILYSLIKIIIFLNSKWGNKCVLTLMF